MELDMNYPCVELGLLRGLHGKDLAWAVVGGVFLKPAGDRDRVCESSPKISHRPRLQYDWRGSLPNSLWVPS